MTITEFLSALPALRDQYVWYEDTLGQLRAPIPGPDGTEHSPMTALAETRLGVRYAVFLEWEHAAQHLGLTPDDAARLVSAEDQDRHHSPVLAAQLRQALGVLRRDG